MYERREKRRINNVRREKSWEMLKRTGQRAEQSKILALKRRSLSATGSCGNCCGGRTRSLDNSHSENFTPTEILYSRQSSIFSVSPFFFYSTVVARTIVDQFTQKQFFKEEISFLGITPRDWNLHISEIYLLFTMEMA